MRLPSEPRVLIDGRPLEGLVSLALHSPYDLTASISPFAPRDALPTPWTTHRVETRIPDGKRCWLFPDDPFITYERRDETWCRPLGIGREGESFDRWIMVPAVLDSIVWDGPDSPLHLRFKGVSSLPFILHPSSFKS